MTKKPNILICPLDWGIGHATRSVPIIRELIEHDANVIIGADKQPLAFLLDEFPGLDYVKVPGFDISYPKKGNMALKMALSSPQIFAGIRKEHRELQSIISACKIDGVISDNRYGLWSKKVPSVFVTHQLFIQTPLLIRDFILRLNLNYINKFDECWIPDFAGENNLSGDLSHKKDLPGSFHFIGPLSRFNTNDINVKEIENERYDILVLLSGPEPQRTILEQKIIEQLKSTDYNCIILKGKPNESENNQLSHSIKVRSHLNTNELIKLIRNSKLIISRPGYSTLMDLAILGKPAILIPTPGQTEQEYLADYYHLRKVYFSMAQRDFDLALAIEKNQEFTGQKLKFEELMLKKRIKSFIAKVS